MIEATQSESAVQKVLLYAERFWEQVDKSPGQGPNGDCWIWLGGKGSTNCSYGRVSIGRKSRPATQVAWEISNCKPFPSGLFACHSCDNPPCVNPAHIWPGTQSQNILDAVAKGRHGTPKRTHCKRGHELTPDNRLKESIGDRCRICNRARRADYMRRYMLDRRARQAREETTNA